MPTLQAAGTTCDSSALACIWVFRALIPEPWAGKNRFAIWRATNKTPILTSNYVNVMRFVISPRAALKNRLVKGSNWSIERSDRSGEQVVAVTAGQGDHAGWRPHPPRVTTRPSSA